MILRVIDYIRIKDFESASNDGNLEVQLSNIGNLTAEFYVSYNCSEYILPLPSTIIRKVIYSLTNDDRLHSCMIILKNSVGQIDDMKEIYFNTTKIKYNNNQGPNNTNPNDTNTRDNDDYEILECSRLCPSFFNFLCFVTHGCWGYFARTLGIIIMVLLIITFLIKWIKKGGCCKLIDKIVGICIFTSESKTKNDNKVNIDNKINYKNVINNKNEKRRTMYLNFNREDFDFSDNNLNDNFSVCVNVGYEIKQNKIFIKSMEINGAFSKILRYYYPENLCAEELKKLVGEIPNFLTEKPLHTILY